MHSLLQSESGEKLTPESELIPEKDGNVGWQSPPLLFDYRGRLTR